MHYHPKRNVKGWRDNATLLSADECRSHGRRSPLFAWSNHCVHKIRVRYHVLPVYLTIRAQSFMTSTHTSNYPINLYACFAFCTVDHLLFKSGCGKTYTMQGYNDPPELRGAILLSFNHIKSSSVNSTFLVRCSYA